MASRSDSTRTNRLLERASTGDRSALDALFSNYRAYLRRVIELRMDDELRRRVDPSDVVQEAQLEAACRIDDYLRKRPISFRLWLRQAALQQLMNLRRKHVLAEKRSVGREVSLPDHSSIALAQTLMEGRPSRVYQRQQLAQQVRQAVSRMEDLDREMLLLRHFEELTNKEAAELLEIDPATASKRYGRALRRFREKLTELGISRGG